MRIENKKLNKGEQPKTQKWQATQLWKANSTQTVNSESEKRSQDDIHSAQKLKARVGTRC